MSAKQIEKLLVDKRPIRNISLKATIDGYVVNFDKVIGQRVQLGETILEIHDPTSARIRGFVTEQEWSRIQLNQTARIRLVGNPGSIADAILVRSDQTLDPISRTLSVWFEIKDPGVDLQFQHNMLARANVKTGQFPPAIAVARESIVTEGRHHYVFVQDQEGRFQRRRIETGRSDDRLVEIKSGLQQGERIAAWGAVDLHSAYVSLR